MESTEHGIAKLRGLDLASLTEADRRIMFYGIGQNLGSPVSMSRQGMMMSDVTDEGAIELMHDVADEVAFETHQDPGEIQLLNNHVVFHGRTAYEDYPEPSRRRLLHRLWISMANSRPLPASFKVLFRETDAGVLRGGIMPNL